MDKGLGVKIHSKIYSDSKEMKAEIWINLWLLTHLPTCYAYNAVQNSQLQEPITCLGAHAELKNRWYSHATEQDSDSDTCCMWKNPEDTTLSLMLSLTGQSPMANSIWFLLQELSSGPKFIQRKKKWYDSGWCLGNGKDNKLVWKGLRVSVEDGHRLPATNGVYIYKMAWMYFDAIALKGLKW